MTAINSGVSELASSSSSWDRDIPLSSPSIFLQSSLQTALSRAETPTSPAAAPASVSRSAVVATTAAGRTAATAAADVPSPLSAAAASSSPLPRAADASRSPFTLGFVDASVAASPTKPAAAEGPAASAAVSSPSPLLPAVGIPPAGWLPRPSSAAVSTAATTPAAAAATPGGGSAAVSRTRLLREEQQAAAGAADSSLPAPPAAELAFLVHSADMVLLAKSFGHPLPSPELSVSRLPGAVASSSPFSTSLPSPLATPSYCQLTVPTSSAAARPSSSGIFSVVWCGLRRLLQQLLLLCASLYASSFYTSSAPTDSSSYLELLVLRLCDWCSACCSLLLSCCLHLLFFFPRLLRLITGESPAPQEAAPALGQGVLAAGLCSTELVPEAAAASPLFQTSAALSSAAYPSAATSFYLLVDGACSDQATQIDGGGALLLTQVLPAVAASGGAAGNIGRSGPRYLTSSSAVLYGHSPAAVVLRNIGKTSSLEATLGVAAYCPPAAADAATATAQPAGAAATAAAEPRPSSWLGLLRLRTQQQQQKSRYPTAAVVLRPAAGTPLVLVGYNDGRLETLQPSTGSSGTSSGSSGYGFSDRWGCRSSCSSRVSSGAGKSVWFAGDDFGNQAFFRGGRPAEEDDLFASRPGEGAATDAGVQAGLSAGAGIGRSFPLWQLLGVEWLRGPVISLRASPGNTRICALTSRCVYILELAEEEQGETAEARWSSSTSYNGSGREALESCYSGGGDGHRQRWCFYRSSRLSSLFAFGKEALYGHCRPLACCWTNSWQLLLLSSDGKLSVFCRDPRKTVGEWRCVARLQLRAAVRRWLRCAMQSNSRSEEESVTRAEASSRSERLGSSGSSREVQTGNDKCTYEGDSCRAVDKGSAAFDSVRDVGLRRRRETRKKAWQQQRSTTPPRDSGAGDKTGVSPATSLFSFSANGRRDALLEDTARTVAAEEGWRRSFPVAVLEYSAPLQLLYLSIRGHAVLQVIPWKTLYASVFFPASSSFFYMSLSSPFCSAAAALSRLAAPGWRGGARGLLESLRSRLLHRHEQLVAPLYEVEFSLPGWMQVQPLQTPQEQKRLLERQEPRKPQRVSRQFAPDAGAAAVNEYTEQQQLAAAARRAAAAATAGRQQQNEEAVGGAAWFDVDSGTRRRGQLNTQAEEKKLPEQQLLGDMKPIPTSAGGILFFAVTTETTGASYVAVIHAGSNSVFVYDANFFDTGELLLQDAVRDDQGRLLVQQEEEQRQLQAPVLRFCLPPPFAACRPAALTFLSSPVKKTPAISFFSPSPAVAAVPAPAVASVLLGVRWVYSRLSRSEGEMKQIVLPAFTAFYLLPSVPATDATQHAGSFWLPSASATRSGRLLSVSAPKLCPHLSASLPPTSAAFRPLGAAAAFSSRVAAAELDTLDAWRTAARVGVPADSAAALNAVVAGGAGASTASSSNYRGNTSLKQRNTCTGLVGCSTSADFLSARGSNPLDLYGDSSNLPNECSSGSGCNFSRDSVPLDSYKEGFFTPAYASLSSAESGGHWWGTGGNAAAQSENILRATAAHVAAPSPRTAEVSSGSAAAGDHLPKNRSNIWNEASPALVGGSRYSGGKGTAACVQQSDMRTSSVLPLGRSSSSAAEASGYYDQVKKEISLGGQQGPAADDFSLTRGETGWVQRWQRQQQKLMQRWHLLQDQQQRVDPQALQSLYQSDTEIPPPLPSSFSRWTPSYPRVAVPKPAPYSLFYPYSSTGLSRPSILPKGSNYYDPLPQQQQYAQEQQPFMHRTDALESGELHDVLRWPVHSTMSPGLFSRAATNFLIPQRVGGGVIADLPVQTNPLRQAFVNSRSFTNRQTVFNDDFSRAHTAASDQSVNGTHTRNNSLMQQQQQLGGSIFVPDQSHARVFTPNTTSNVLLRQPLLPAASPARLAVGTSNLFELGLSKGAESGVLGGQSYSDAACVSLQRNPLASSALRISNTSILQPFTNSMWTANYSTGPRTSIL